MAVHGVEWICWYITFVKYRSRKWSQIERKAFYHSSSAIKTVNITGSELLANDKQKCKRNIEHIENKADKWYNQSLGYVPLRSWISRCYGRRNRKTNFSWRWVGHVALLSVILGFNFEWITVSNGLDGRIFYVKPGEIEGHTTYEWDLMTIYFSAARPPASNTLMKFAQSLF